MQLTKKYKLWLGDGEDPQGFDQVYGVTDLQLPQSTFDTRETTNLDDDDEARTFIGTLKTIGQLTFTLLHDSSDSIHQDIEDAFDDQSIKDFRITSPLSGDITFNGWVTSHNRGTAIANLVETMVVVTINGVTDEVPTVESVTLLNDDTSYVTDETITLVVKFSEVVKIDTTDGTPRIALDINGETKYAVAQSPFISNLFHFQYTFVAEDEAATSEFSVGTLALNSGTIQDMKGQNATPLTFDSPDTSSIAIN